MIYMSDVFFWCVIYIFGLDLTIFLPKWEACEGEMGPHHESSTVVTRTARGPHTCLLLPLCCISAQVVHGFFGVTSFQWGRVCKPTYRCTCHGRRSPC